LGVAVLVLLGLELLLRFLVPNALNPIAVDRAFRIYQAEPDRRHPWSAAATNVLRIAVIGDSVTAGVGNHRYDRFASRLEWLMNLNERVPPVEVDVFAKPTATYQQRGLLDQAFAYQPKVVIFVVHLNDTEDWSSAGKLVRLRERMMKRAPPQWLLPLLRRSALVHLAYFRWVERQERRAFLKYYEYIYRADYPGLAKFRKAIQRFHRQCMDHGMQMVAVLFPQLNQDMMAGRYPFERMHAVVRQACENETVPFLDLLDAYRFCVKERDENILLLDAHPNEIGHRVAADAIFHFLLEKSIVDPAYRPMNAQDLPLIEKWKRKLRAMDVPIPEGR
jgi:lysophospholipase L1-like esterase